jgi:hypothetical protein
MSTVNIDSNTLNVKQCDSIQVKGIAQVPLYAIWLLPQGKMVFSHLDRADRDNTSGSGDQMRLKTIAAIVYGLHRILMSLFNSHNISTQLFSLGEFAPSELTCSVRAGRDTLVADYSAPSVNTMRCIVYHPTIADSVFLRVLSVSNCK